MYLTYLKMFLNKYIIAAIGISLITYMAYSKGKEVTETKYKKEIQLLSIQYDNKLAKVKLDYQNQLSKLNDDISFKEQEIIDYKLSLDTKKEQKIKKDNKQYETLVKKVTKLSIGKKEDKTTKWLNEEIPPVIYKGLSDIKRN